MLMPPDPSQLRDYEVNVLVDNSETKKPPVVFETTPTFETSSAPSNGSWIGRGCGFPTIATSRQVAFLKANGGYLVLNARDVLMEVGVYPALKRSLRNRVVEIQSDPFSFLFTTALKPEKDAHRDQGDHDRGF